MDYEIIGEFLGSIVPQVNKKSANNKKYILKTFKGLIRETSVYKYYVELKEDAMTEQGFFDLVKVPNLRVAGTGQFLKNIRMKNRLRLVDIAKILKSGLSTVSQWEKNVNRIPLHSLINIAEAFGVSKSTIYSFIDQGKLSLKNVTLPVKFEKINDIIPYISPQTASIRAPNVLTILKCSIETLSEIKDTLNVTLHINSRDKRIYSRDLYNYLTTFFQYSRVPKIYPPLTSEVKFWHEEGIDLNRSIIIPCLQSDGCVSRPKSNEYNYMIHFDGRNSILHNYFVDAVYYEYDLLPTSYCLYNADTKMYRTSYTQKIVKTIVNDITKLAGNTKTSPASRQTIDGYLKEPQPHLNYLINAPETEKKIAFRIWMSTEGCVTINKRREETKRGIKNDYLNPLMMLACAHPILAKQLQLIAKQFNIILTLKRSKTTWSGISKLINGSLSACIEFLKFGGFIKGVKVSKNSKYHEGIYKDVLFLGILELKQRV
jgi:transcriptional regulator with XRE-family HTH domain